MPKKISIIFILSLFLSFSLFAQDQENTQLATSDKAVTDQGSAQVQETPPLQQEQTLEVDEKILDKHIPSYSYNLKQLIAEAEKNIKKVEAELNKKEKMAKQQEKDKEMRKLFEEGNSLYQEGKPQEAIKTWEKVLDLSKDPQMKEYILNCEKEIKDTNERENRLKRLEEDKKECEIKEAYRSGLAFYKLKRYSEAQEYFQKVAELKPNYLKTDEYLKKIPTDIENEGLKLEKKKKQEEIKSLSRKATSLFKENKLTESEEEFKKILILDPNDKTAKDYIEKKIPNKNKDIKK